MNDLQRGEDAPKGVYAAKPQHLMLGAGILGGLGAGLGMALAGYAFYLEPFNIELDHLVVRVPHARGRLPAGGLKILHLSDFHFQGKDERERDKIDRIRHITAGIEYDLLINTGDFLQYDDGLANVLALYDALPQPRIGSFAVMGNHDYATYNMRKAIPYTWRNFLARESRYRKAPPMSMDLSRRERVGRYLRFALYLFFRRVEGERTGRNDVARLHYELERLGTQWLHNRAIHINGNSGVGGVDLYIAGIDDLNEGRPNLATALRPVPEDAPLILVSHNPDILESPAALRADLLLAGHTHGGQIVLPLFGPAHTQSDHLSRREAAGYFRRGKTHIYINRGLGEGIPLRFGAPPHVTLIEMRGE
jgi:predicted MPP superfamily phosphohydrolase